jgi:hypothetical protein
MGKSGVKIFGSLDEITMEFNPLIVETRDEKTHEN